MAGMQAFRFSFLFSESFFLPLLQADSYPETLHLYSILIGCLSRF